MKTVSIFRHAKSSWENPHLDDFERPLLPKGINRTKKIINFIKAQELFPDIIYSSPAIRARHTAELLNENLKPKHQIQWIESFYPGSVRQIIGQVQQTTKSLNHIMLVGHNPSLSDLAAKFTNDRNEWWIPTSGLVVFTFDIDSWNQLSTNQGKLLHYIKPKTLSK